MPTGSLRQKNCGWAQGDGTKGNQYLHQLLLSFTTKFCSRINFMTKKKGMKEEKKWRRPHLHAEVAWCRGASPREGSGTAPRIHMLSYEPGPGLLYGRGHKEFTSQGKICFQTTSHFHPSVLNPTPDTTKCLPYLTLVNLDSSSVFFFK